MGGHFKTKQPYSTRNICCRSRAALPSSWGVTWDYSSPCLWERWSSQSFHATGPPMKGAAAEGVPSLRLKARCHRRSDNSHRGKLIPHRRPEGRQRAVRCGLPAVMNKLHRAAWVRLQAKSFRAGENVKSATKARRGGQGKKKEKQHVTYPQSIQLIVPRPFTSWATLDSNLSELSAAAAGRKRKINHQQHYYCTQKTTVVHSFVLKHWNNIISNLKKPVRRGSAKPSVN